jgi:thiamine pyrophosphate-dependent acetolactate synthase large subunit-like protein
LQPTSGRPVEFEFLLQVISDADTLSACRHRRRRAPGNGIAPHGMHLGGVDWDKLGQAFGADIAVVKTEQALTSALAAARSSRAARP